MQLVTLAEDSPYDRHQTIAANTHRSLLLWWKKGRPHVNRRSRSMDNLQEMLNTTSFQQFQIAQTKAQTPTQICAFIFLSIPLSQFPKKIIDIRGLNMKCTTRQTRNAK
jgi:hypothetical protein